MPSACRAFPEDWTRAAEEAGLARFRWSLVGNAVSVPVARWIGERLAAPGTHDAARDRDLSDGARWPDAARFDGTRRHGVAIGAHPVAGRHEGLTAFLRHPGKPLSIRATAGFLDRLGTDEAAAAAGFPRLHRRSPRPPDGGGTAGSGVSAMAEASAKPGRPPPPSRRSAHACSRA